ncbi:MAG: hypothetical protein IJC35_04310 [Oscillospiraceae bacterium]|nr:hypothetical protein [Oscillospiraceae bacterium]
MTKDFERAFAFPSGGVLRRRAETGTLNQAYILPLPADHNLFTALAASALCSAPDRRPCGICPHCRKVISGSHPDFRRFAPEKDKRIFPVSLARDLREEAWILPNEAERKVFLLEAADTMNGAAQNALLKILEEPPAGTLFLLQCENPGRFLETIRSRCTVVQTEAEAASSGQEEAASEYLDLVLGNSPAELARFLQKTEKLPRPELAAFLGEAKRQAVSRLPRASRSDALRLHKTQALLARAERFFDANVSGGHIAGLLLSGGAEMRNQID